MKKVQLIFNEIHKDGKYKAIYFDTERSHDNGGTFLKVIENGQMKLHEVSEAQRAEMHQKIDSFMGGVPHYKFSEYDKADSDFTLLVGISGINNDLQRFYNWQNTTPIPKGVDLLLKFLNNIIVEKNPTV